MSEVSINENMGEVFPHILSIFEEIFGEDYVSYSCITPTINEIIVYFPEVLMTNDYNEQHKITDVYVRIELSPEGRIIDSLSLRRTSFTSKELDACYVHSHVPRLDTNNISWSHCCLGTGPLSHVFNVLQHSFDTLTTEEVLELYKVMALNIKEYVKVESNAGGPYIKFSSIKEKLSLVYTDLNECIGDFFNNALKISSDNKELVMSFCEYLIERFSVKNSLTQKGVCIGETFINTVKYFTNMFIAFLKDRNLDKDNNLIKEFIKDNILVKGSINGFNIQVQENRASSLHYEIPENREIIPFYFKGHLINHFTINEESYEEDNEGLLLLNPKLINIIIRSIYFITNALI